MPVYLRKTVNFSPESLQKFDPNEEDPTDFLTDPDNIKDVLPQPFRFIDKMVNTIVERAWVLYVNRQETRKVKASRVRPPLYRSGMQIKKFSTCKTMCTSPSGQYVILGMSKGLVVLQADTQKAVDEWRDEKLAIVQVVVQNFADVGLLMCTIDRKGIGRLFALYNNHIFLLYTFNDPESELQPNLLVDPVKTAKGGPTQPSSQASKKEPKPKIYKIQASEKSEFVAVNFRSQTKYESWLEVFKLNREALVKELESYNVKLFKALETASVSAVHISEDSAAQPVPPAMQIPPQTSVTEDSADQHSKEKPDVDKSTLKFTAPAAMLKVRPPHEFKPSMVNNASQAVKMVQKTYRVIGTGIKNHAVTYNHMMLRYRCYRALNRKRLIKLIKMKKKQRREERAKLRQRKLEARERKMKKLLAKQREKELQEQQEKDKVKGKRRGSKKTQSTPPTPPSKHIKIDAHPQEPSGVHKPMEDELPAKSSLKKEESLDHSKHEVDPETGHVRGMDKAEVMLKSAGQTKKHASLLKRHLKRRNKWAQYKVPTVQFLYHNRNCNKQERPKKHGKGHGKGANIAAVPYTGPSQILVSWTWWHNICIYPLNKTSKELELSPDQVMPCANVVRTSQLSSDHTMLALAFKNNVVSVYDLVHARLLAIVQPSVCGTIIKLAFLHPSVCPFPKVAKPKENGLMLDLFPNPIVRPFYVLVAYSTGKMYTVQCGLNATPTVNKIYGRQKNYERHTVIQIIDSLPNLAVTCRRNGQVFIEDIVRGTIICQLGMPSVYRVFTPWQPIFEVAGQKRDVLFIRGITKKGQFDQTAKMIKTAEHRHLRLKYALFVFDLRRLRSLAHHWHREEMFRDRWEADSRYVPKLKLKDRISLILEERAARAPVRAEAVKNRWKTLLDDAPMMQELYDKRLQGAHVREQMSNSVNKGVPKISVDLQNSMSDSLDNYIKERINNPPNTRRGKTARFIRLTPKTGATTAASLGAPKTGAK